MAGRMVFFVKAERG